MCIWCQVCFEWYRAPLEVIKCDSTTYSCNFISCLSISSHSTPTPVKTHNAGCHLQSPAAGKHRVFIFLPHLVIWHIRCGQPVNSLILRPAALDEWGHEVGKKPQMPYCCQHGFPLLEVSHSKKCLVGGTQLQSHVTASSLLHYPRCQMHHSPYEE